MAEHDNEHDDEMAGEDEAGEQALEMESPEQAFLELRRQNIDLLKLSIDIAGLGGNRPPLKPNEMKSAMKNLWDLYSEFYSWIDPSESDEDDEDYEG